MCSSPTQAELKEQDQSILQNFLSVRNTLYTIWETHRLIVKEQEEMKYYNETDDKSDISSPTLTSPVSPVEKEPLGRIGSGLFSSIQKQSEERGITSPITKKLIFTSEDIQEDTSNDIGPSGSLVSIDKPWYKTGSIEHLPKLAATAKEAHSHYRNSSKAATNYKKKEHIYESIDDVLAELKQNQGSSPNYATLHKWTNQLTTGQSSTSSSSSGSATFDSKISTSSVSSKSTSDRDSTGISSRPTGDHDSTSSVSAGPAGDHQHSKGSRPSSAKDQRSHSYSASNVKMPMQDDSHPPPLLQASLANVNVPHLTDVSSQVRHSRQPSFPEPTATTLHQTDASSQMDHIRQASGSELLNTNTSSVQDVMIHNQSARWIRRQSHQPGRSQSPTINNPSMYKDSYLTPQLTRSVKGNAQNGIQHQTQNTRFLQLDDYNPLAEENSVCLNFSNEVLSIFNFQQQQQVYPAAADKRPSRSASSSSTSSHGRLSVPLKSSPSPDLCVNPLGGPRISPPPDNQTSAFCHVPRHGRNQSSGTNLPYRSVNNTTVDVPPKLSAKRSMSSSQNNLLNDMSTDYHTTSFPSPHRNSLSYQNSPLSSPALIKKDSVDGMSAAIKRDIMDCPNSPRFPRRSLTRSPGQNAIFKGTNIQTSQPRIAKFTAPPPPTVAPPKLHQQYSSDFRPTMSGHVRPYPKVEQTWC